MNRKETREQVSHLLSTGLTKNEVFDKLTEQGAKERYVAFLIASHPDPKLCVEYRGHLLAVRIIAWVEGIIAVLLGFSLGAQLEGGAALIIVALCLGFAVLFIWGFTKNKAGVYNAYLILTIIHLPRQLPDAFQDSTSFLMFLVSIGLVAYIWHVRTLIFPDFVFISPRKKEGKYVFA